MTDTDKFINIDSLLNQLFTLQDGVNHKPRRHPRSKSRATQIDLSITGPKIPSVVSTVTGQKTITDTDPVDTKDQTPQKIKISKCKPRRNVKKIEPQLDEAFRPKTWANQVFGYIQDKETGKFKCQLCDFSANTTNSIGMHMPLHFPPRKDLCCQQCGDCFHIKTAYIQHFLIKCSLCGEEVRESSWPAHKNKHANKYTIKGGV